MFKWVRDELGELAESYNKPYTITITNVDNKPAKFEAQVVDR
ncbi:hypothetical protein [Streptococcus sanguinis]|uniref:Uncharacterized protein n=1 Tax=Streptococcus sanguinis SK408 TaxID=888818 RepID=F2CBY3_STRSA|nr:hypothetical protein [Streptococcus sanguinis]EGF20311.1 hypothetical protein HMPREF9391_0420 [Streptococcus sanguinis SK408]